MMERDIEVDRDDRPGQHGMTVRVHIAGIIKLWLTDDEARALAADLLEYSTPSPATN